MHGQIRGGNDEVYRTITVKRCSPAIGAEIGNIDLTRPLTELELAYTVHNVGKEQWADMGPAVMRAGLGSYKPKPGGRREKLLAQWGRMQLPYLEDANTGAKMFESAKIIDYLEQHYAS